MKVLEYLDVIVIVFFIVLLARLIYSVENCMDTKESNIKFICNEGQAFVGIDSESLALLDDYGNVVTCSLDK